MYIVEPNDQTSELAESATIALRSLQPNSNTVEIRVGDRSVILPTPVFSALIKVLELLGIGRVVRIDPIDDEVTTELAARRLGVSRPHLVSLLEKGEIPFRKVGSRRRIRASDLAVYVQARDAKAREKAAQLESFSPRCAGK